MMLARSNGNRVGRREAEGDGEEPAGGRRQEVGGDGEETVSKEIVES
jgi:hypothetical protein